jgi:hypothetical protein
MELFGGIGSRNFAYAKAAHQTDDRESKKNRAGIHLPSRESRGQDRSAHASGDNTEESPQLEHAIAPGKFFRGQELRKQAVFGRPKERPLRAHKEDRCQGQRKIRADQGNHSEQHHADFKHFSLDRDATLAKAVCEIPAG